MAETDVAPSATSRFRNPAPDRFSNNRSAGFAGGSTNPLGNYVPPSAGQIGGLNEAPPPAPKTAITGISATDGIPRAGTTSGGIGAQLAGKAASEFGKEAITRAGRALGFGQSPDFSTPLGGSLSDAPVSINTGYGPASSTASLSQPLQFGDRADTSQFQSLAAPASGFDPATGFDASSADAFYGGGGASVGEGLSALDYGPEAFDIGGDFAGDALGDSAGGAGGIPFLGAGIQLARGNVGGAVGSVVGNLILPGIGGIIGSFLGGALGGGGCFITTAVCRIMGKGDDCNELETLRWLRDTVMSIREDWRALAAEYDVIAPGLVQRIDAGADGGRATYQRILDDYILPAVKDVRNGNFEMAVAMYERMVKELLVQFPETSTEGA